MATIREQILVKIDAALTTALGTSATTWRSRAVAMAREEFPAVVTEPLVDEAKETDFHTLTLWKLTVRVAVLVKGDIPDQVGDLIGNTIHSVMTGNPTWDGLATDTAAASVNWELLEADITTGVIPYHFVVSYRTLQNDISAQWEAT